MTPEHIKEVVRDYAVILQAEGYVSVENRAATGVSSQLGHVLWMCERIPTLLGVGSIEKAHRWFGFVQGVFWFTGLKTIDEMAAQNRSRGDGSQDQRKDRSL